jgi:hypothetical protein
MEVFFRLRDDKGGGVRALARGIAVPEGSP